MTGCFWPDHDVFGLVNDARTGKLRRQSGGISGVNRTSSAQWPIPGRSGRSGRPGKVGSTGKVGTDVGISVGIGRSGAGGIVGTGTSGCTLLPPEGLGLVLDPPPPAGLPVCFGVPVAVPPGFGPSVGVRSGAVVGTEPSPPSPAVGACSARDTVRVATAVSSASDVRACSRESPGSA